MSTVVKQEIEHFKTLSDQWWDEEGPFKALHQLNPLRIQYIKEHTQEHFQNPLKGLRVLDLGCGGGLLSEPLKCLGADLTSIDACAENIEIARYHATQVGLEMDYRAMPAEDLDEQFDVVCALEILEHVASPKDFIKVCADRVKPGGLLFLSTLNRTFKAYLFAVKLAEDILNMVPKGTHQWQKFVRPKELTRWLEQNGFEVFHKTGISLDLIHKSWKSSEDLDINYMLVARKAIEE